MAATFHPASILCGWFAILWLCALTSGAALAATTLFLMAMAWLWARKRIVSLIKRSRWLLLALGLTFAFMTPGQYLIAALGLTYEGIQLGLESVARLICALASLALVLDAVSTVRLVVGLRSLLAPLDLFATTRGLRDRIAVRLILTLEAIESRERAASDDRMVLPAIPFHAADGVLGAGLVIALVWMAA